MHIFSDTSSDSKDSFACVQYKRYICLSVEELFCHHVAARTSSDVLATAAFLGHTECVRLLLMVFKEDPEKPSSVFAHGVLLRGVRPLWLAVAGGNLEAAALLLSKGADPNAVNPLNPLYGPPLLEASSRGYCKIVRMLLLNGADIEAEDGWGVTSLKLAAFNGHYETTRLLLDFGARVDRRSQDGQTALHDCARSGHVAVLDLLLCRSGTLQPDSKGYTPMMTACYYKQMRVVEYLVHRSKVKPTNQRVDDLDLSELHL